MILNDAINTQLESALLSNMVNMTQIDNVLIIRSILIYLIYNISMNCPSYRVYYISVLLC